MKTFELIDNIPCFIADRQGKTPDIQDCISFVKASPQQWQALLLKHGALVFRGFNCRSADDFSKLIDACRLGERLSTKTYSIARTILEKEIYTSSDLHPSVNIALHHEKPRSLIPAHHIYFGSMISAKEGGATVFVSAEKILQELPAALKEKLDAHGVIYQACYRDANSYAYKFLSRIFGKNFFKTWQGSFKTSNIDEVEQQLNSKAYLNWQRRKNDFVTTSKLDAIRKHPQTHQQLWFNSADYLSLHSNWLYKNKSRFNPFKRWVINYLVKQKQLPLVCYCGDGTEFSEEEISIMNQIIQQNKWMFNWQDGDFMIVDNYLLMHGKQPHQGERLLYSCMTIKNNLQSSP